MYKVRKLEKGITLISLIVTIIVLLILVGISIGTLFGENGLLKRIEYSKIQSIIGEEKEQIALAWNTVKANELGGTVTAEKLEEQLNGKAKVVAKENRIIITFNKTGNKYYLNEQGKINKLEKNDAEIDIATGDIIFIYSIEGKEYNEDIWTNKNVTVTAKINEEKIKNSSEYKIQMTSTPEAEESWETRNAEEFTTNGKIYVRLIDKFERKTLNMVSANVTNIDKDIPTIGDVNGSTEVRNTGIVTVSSIEDIGSGLSGIYISTSSTIPTAGEKGWENNIESNYKKTVSSNGTYYVWVKDVVGNISEVKSCTVSGIVSKVTGVTVTNTTVNIGATVTIAKTIIGSTSYKSIEFASSNTSVATITSDTGVATGVSAGTSTITCTVTNYDGTIEKGICTLTVKEPQYLLASKVKVGDYVAYDTTNKYSYTSPAGNGQSHGNGNDNQTFTSSSDIKWRVLSTNKSTGEVVLISEEPIGTDDGQNLKLTGVIGYLYAEQELNEICKIYGYGKGADTSKKFTYQTGDVVEGVKTGTITGSGARSIKAEDLYNIYGIIPGSSTTSYSVDGIFPTTANINGYTSSTINRTYYKSPYINKNADASTEIGEVLFGDKDNFCYKYTLSTRTIGASKNQIDFRLGHVGGSTYSNSDGKYGAIVGSSGWMCYYYAPTKEWRQGGSSDKIRPIVYLKTNIKTSGQDANGAWKIIDN